MMMNTKILACPRFKVDNYFFGVQKVRSELVPYLRDVFIRGRMVAFL